MIFNKHINKYYLKYLLFYIIGVLALVMVDFVQTRIPVLLRDIIDDGEILVTSQAALWNIIGRVLLYAGLMAIGRIVWRLAIFRASTGIEANLRKEMFEKAERLPVSYYHDTKVGTIMSWFTNDIETIGEYFGWGTIMLVDAVFLSIIVVVSMVIEVNWAMTVVAAIPIALIVVWGALVEKIMSKKWEERQKAADELYDFAQENFTGIRVIKAFVKDTKEVHAFAKVAKKNKDVNVNFARLSVGFDVIIEIIIGIEMAMILGFGGYFVYYFTTGSPASLFGTPIEITVGQLTAFIAYVELLIWPMIALGQIITMRSRTKTSLKRVSNYLDTPEDIHNPENPVVLGEITGKISFNHFSFKYLNTDFDCLKDITLTINPGETIGVVGKIGSGKTTLVNVLLRLYNIEESAIFFDDNDMMKCDIASIRENIAYVPQDNFLFSDKICNNISFSSSDVDMDKVVEAAKFADVDDNIVEFIDGYDTISGERGVTLSGGQKQRVSIARAYYKDAPILILDDSVSAVDVKTEENILKNIKEKRAGKTTILVASRVSTVMHLDRIIVLNNGELEAFGSHEELLKISPTYERMVYLQELESEVEGGK